ncbi:toll-like receptor 3 [Amphiura filiformis]|uniref:toll-like receptor 3 n=1 Tax=Amphiura filiformis TaxID=82378 RepID=UPI003B2216AD
MTADSFKGLVNLDTLDLTYNSISKVNPDVFVDQGNLKTLLLHHNQINKLETTSFDHTKELKKLDLSYQNNGMGNTNWYALNVLTKLEELYLEQVKLTSVDFAQGEPIVLKSLKVLNLTFNLISTISDGDFAILQGTNLQFLTFSNNPLTSIGDNIFGGISSIQTLDASSAITPEMLPSLSQALSNMDVNKLVLQNIGLDDLKSNYFQGLGNSSLQELDCAFNNITKLDSGSFGLELKNVTQLNFYMNTIAQIDMATFKNLTSLRVLDLSNNSLTEVTPAMFNSLNGSHIEELYLHNNLIHTISPQYPFRGLKNLKYLKLSKNKIKHTFTGSEFEGLKSLQVLDLGLNSEVTLYPNTFSNLTTLKILYINAAHLRKADAVPSPFSKLISLVTLDLSNNSLPSIDTSSFDNLNSLETLYLQHNNLYSTWDPSKGDPRLFLRNLTKLKLLDLSWNGFKVIPDKVFFNLTNLIDLRLGRNKISHIAESVFVNVKRLSYLELNNNEINVVNKTILKPILDSLVSLTVGYNPFSCSCALLWFRQWIDTTSVRIEDLDDCLCSSPPDMAGMKVEQYHPDARECEDKLSVYAIIAMGVGSVVVLGFITIVFMFRSYCIYGYYYVRARRRGYEHLHGDNNEYDYDAFVSFSGEDTTWVREYLETELEQKDDFRLCLHYRDFRAGGQIVDNITESVEKSRRTLCVISQNYLESQWCKFERKLVVYKLFAEFKDSLIIILLEDIPDEKLSKYDKIHRTLKKQTYLQWPPKAGIDRHNFWFRLKAALRGNRRQEDNTINV